MRGGSYRLSHRRNLVSWLLNTVIIKSSIVLKTKAINTQTHYFLIISQNCSIVFASLLVVCIIVAESKNTVLPYVTPCISSNSEFSDITLVAWSRPRWECLHTETGKTCKPGLPHLPESRLSNIGQPCCPPLPLPHSRTSRS